MVLKPTSFSVDMPIENEMTMADDEDDPAPFIPVLNSKPNKKVKPNPSEEERAKHIFETDLRIIINLPSHPSTKLNVLSYTKNLFSAITNHDDTTAIISPERTLYIAHDPFPKDEEAFGKYFLIHPPGTHPKTRHQVVIGCKIATNKSVQEIKKSKTGEHNMILWLQKHHIYLEADSLGITTVRTVGYMFNIHRQISHRTYLKETLFNELEKVKMTVEEAQTLDFTARQFHEENDNDTYVPPFEIYPTTIGHGTGNNKRVETNTVGIKSNIEHVALLKEMFIRIPQTETPNKPMMKFIPHGIVHSIGHEAYVALIKSNNQFLLSIATIPVNGITAETLELKINAYDPRTKTTKKSIRNILLDNHWCHGLEPTNDHGKILLLTTRAHLAMARQWLDDNLPIMFESHLKQHPEFKPDEDFPVAQRTARKPISTTMQTYAAAIKSTIPTFAAEDKTTKKFAKPPKNNRTKIQQYTFDPEDFPEHNPTKASTNTNTEESNKTTIQDSAKTNSEQNQTNANKQNHEHANITQVILQTVTQNINQMISDQVQTELKPIRQEIRTLQADIGNKHTQVTETIFKMQAQLTALLTLLSPPPSSNMEVGGD